MPGQSRFLSNPLTRLATAVAVAAAILACGRGEIARVLEMYPDALPAHPRLILDHALLLYLVTPLTVVAAIVVMLAPGALLVLLRGGRETAPEMLLTAFLGSMAVRTGLQTIWKLAGGTVTPSTFAVLDAAAFVGLIALARIRRSRPGAPDVLWMSGTEGRRLVGYLAVPFVFVVAFLPELFWKDMIGDGFETLYSGATLSTNCITRFSTGSGFYGTGIGLLSQAYPLSWFGTFFGFTEPASRLPVVLYAMLICAAVVALAEWRTPRKLTWGEESTIALAIAAFVATLGFNSSYNAYAADFAAPLTVETLTVLCILGVVFTAWSDRTPWCVSWAVLGAFNRPNMVLVLGALILATLVVRQPQWRRVLFNLGVALVVCIGLSALYEKVYLARVSSVQVEGLNQSVLGRLRYLQFTDVRRFLYVVVPSGILPAFALLAYRRQDACARTVSLLTLLYFAVFYVETYYSLHHFAPVMVLPLVVYWRLASAKPANRRLTIATALGGIAAVAIAFPWGDPIPRDVQTLARSIDLRLSRMDPVATGDATAAERRSVLGQIFPQDWQVDDTSRRWAFDVFSLAYYAHRAADLGIGKDPALVRIQSRSDDPPPGWQPAATTATLAAFVRDPAALQSRLDEVPSTQFAARVYRIRREQLLNYRGILVPIHELDLRSVLDRILQMLGRPPTVR